MRNLLLSSSNMAAICKRTIVGRVMSLLMTRNRIFAVTREAGVLRENTESRKSEGGEGGAR